MPECARPGHHHPPLQPADTAGGPELPDEETLAAGDVDWCAVGDVRAVLRHPQAGFSSYGNGSAAGGGVIGMQLQERPWRIHNGDLLPGGQRRLCGNEMVYYESRVLQQGGGFGDHATWT